jgi:predicted phosphodiesterase
MKAQIVKDYLQKFPNTPTKTLAKAIYKDNKAVWSNMEAVRTSIRHYRGQRGDKNRAELADKSFITKPGKLNPFENLPKGMTEYSDWSPVKLDGKRFLLIADTHIPYHSHNDLGIALQHGKESEIDTIVILGDFIDFYSCSFWETDPRKRDFGNEIRTAQTVLDFMRKQFPKARIVYKLGNHEERYERYMRVKAPELLGYEAFEFGKLIESDKYGIELIGDKRIVKIGRLHCIHGHEFWRGVTNPVNPARGLYLRGKEIAVCAHYHQSSGHTEPSLSDFVTSCWSIGMLCDKHPSYCPSNKWNFGFAYVENDDGFELHNYKIIDGRVYHA